MSSPAVDYQQAIELIRSITSPPTQEEEEDTSSFFSVDRSTFLLQSALDVQSKEMVRSIGCLQRYLTAYLAQTRFQGDTPSLPIRSFTLLELDHYMMIDRVGITSSREP